MRLAYFRLETVKARYTKQLCEEWMPEAFDLLRPAGLTYHTIGHDKEIPLNTGSVLDAVGRPTYALQQCQEYLANIDTFLQEDTAIYLQDFYTPGLDSLLYAMELKGKRLPIYAMCHAQSVDKYDFTHPMAYWMRHYELMLDGWMEKNGGGIFVASTVHKDLLREAGFKAPIAVVGLPISVKAVERMMPKDLPKERAVVYSSRLDPEKRPEFMLDVANMFLQAHHDWSWWITTSAKTLKAHPENLARIESFKEIYGDRFQVFVDQSKDQYYERLCRASIQFNSALQDFVSWTLLEAVLAGCEIAYPNYNSFPECVPSTRRYHHESVNSAFELLHYLAGEIKADRGREHSFIARECDYGRRLAAAWMVTGKSIENLNIWRKTCPTQS
jgi:glycosyltransferase involved in cell wall biosynthesis